MKKTKTELSRRAIGISKSLSSNPAIQNALMERLERFFSNVRIDQAEILRLLRGSKK